ncbi:MAG: tetraacyldisaccharide 4'-kinase [Leptospira sp.]|nr:tetraacyldisaccharide 4'-kinase [Leptospira sp.]
MKSIISFFLRVLLWTLSPLSYIYQLLFFVDRKRANAQKLGSCLVISVGNLTMGGTGKTPFVQYLIKIINEKFPNYQITVLSRGYKALHSKDGAIVKVDSLPNEVGDEPLLHKITHPNVKVIIGKNRIESFKKFNQIDDKKHIVILDDGFQHHKLKRDFDIVLIDTSDPEGNGFTIPLGTLREKKTSLLRADLVVFTKVNDANISNAKTFESSVKKINPKLLCFYSTFNASKKLIFGEVQKLNKLNIITGVGNPNSVLASALETFGDMEMNLITFPDHYAYTDDELISLTSNLKDGEVIVTTEKDWVKWKSLHKFIEIFKNLKYTLFVLKINMELNEEEKLKRLLDSLVSNYEKEISQV